MGLFARRPNRRKIRLAAKAPPGPPPLVRPGLLRRHRRYAEPLVPRLPPSARFRRLPRGALPMNLAENPRLAPQPDRYHVDAAWKAWLGVCAICGQARCGSRTGTLWVLHFGVNRCPAVWGAVQPKRRCDDALVREPVAPCPLPQGGSRDRHRHHDSDHGHQVFCLA
jgi:hypothetical protein